MKTWVILRIKTVPGAEMENPLQVTGDGREQH